MEDLTSFSSLRNLKVAVGNNAFDDAVIVFAILSFVTTLLSMIVFMALPLATRNRSFMSCIWYIFTANIFASIPTLIVKPANKSFECDIQAFMFTYFSLVLIFWATVLCVLMWSIFVKMKVFPVDTWYMKCLCFGVPALLTSLPLTTEEYGLDKMDDWCGLEVGPNTPYWTYTFWHIFSYMGWMVGCLVVMIGCFIHVSIRIIKSRSLGEFSPVMERALKKLIFYPTLIIVTRGVLAGIEFFDVFLGEDPSRTMARFGWIALSLGGFLNSIVFYLNARTTTHRVIRLMFIKMMICIGVYESGDYDEVLDPEDMPKFLTVDPRGTDESFRMWNDFNRESVDSVAESIASRNTRYRDTTESRSKDRYSENSTERVERFRTTGGLASIPSKAIDISQTNGFGRESKAPALRAGSEGDRPRLPSMGLTKDQFFAIFANFPEAPIPTIKKRQKGKNDSRSVSSPDRDSRSGETFNPVTTVNTALYSSNKLRSASAADGDKRAGVYDEKIKAKEQEQSIFNDANRSSVGRGSWFDWLRPPSQALRSQNFSQEGTEIPEIRDSSSVRATSVGNSSSSGGPPAPRRPSGQTKLLSGSALYRLDNVPEKEKEQDKEKEPGLEKIQVQAPLAPVQQEPSRDSLYRFASDKTTLTDNHSSDDDDDDPMKNTQVEVGRPSSFFEIRMSSFSEESTAASSKLSTSNAGGASSNSNNSP